LHDIWGVVMGRLPEIDYLVPSASTTLPSLKETLQDISFLPRDRHQGQIRRVLLVFAVCCGRFIIKNPLCRDEDELQQLHVLSTALIVKIHEHLNHNELRNVK